MLELRLTLASAVGNHLECLLNMAIYNLSNPPELIHKAAELRLATWTTAPDGVNPLPDVGTCSEAEK